MFSKTLTLVRMKIGHAEAVRLGELMRGSQAISMIEVNDSDRDEAWRLFKTYSNHELSFVDCTSFAVMKRLAMKNRKNRDRHYYLDKSAESAGDCAGLYGQR